MCAHVQQLLIMLLGILEGGFGLWIIGIMSDNGCKWDNRSNYWKLSLHCQQFTKIIGGGFSWCKLALSRKQVSPDAAERNELLRATWQAAYADIPADYIVWLDESSVDDRTNQRQMGWAQVGRACVRKEFFVRGQRYSVLPALTCDGYIALDIFEGAVNKEKFLTFLNEQLVCFSLFCIFESWPLHYIGLITRPRNSTHTLVQTALSYLITAPSTTMKTSGGW